MDRSKKIVQTSIIGILTNVGLAIFKVIVGMLSNSIAIILDAVNNVSDALSSVITILGTKLAGKRPDKKHPYGYGRIEYMSALLISMIVLYAGFTSLIESVKKIINPEVATYSIVTLVIIAVGVIVKFVLGKYVKSVGVSTDSDALQNSGDDALNDAVISGTTLVAALVYIGFGISLEAYLGTIISIVIVKSGVDMLVETISRILGERSDSSLAREIKKTVNMFHEVRGTYDLVLHDYGPEHTMGSFHIEVDDTLNATQIDQLTRQIVDKVYEENHVVITGVSIYSKNTQGEKAREIEKQIQNIVMNREYVVGMHGFYLNEDDKTMRFDVVIDLSAGDVRTIYDQISKDIHEQFGEYNIRITLDVNQND